jgi:hypothetical protein
MRDDSRRNQYTVTNITEDRILNCNENSDLATADVLGTLIKDLIERGIISGSIA